MAEPRQPHNATDAIGDEWAVLSARVLATTRKYAVKDNDAFVVTDDHGDIPCQIKSELGYYHADTRYLAGLELTINGRRPLLLSCRITDDGGEIVAEMTNADCYSHERVLVPRATIYIQRSLTLRDDVLYQRLRLRSFAAAPTPITVEFGLAADFADIFEVRGTVRPRRGRLHEPELGHDTVQYRYEGLDGQLRWTRVRFDPAPYRLARDRAVYRVETDGRSETVIEMAAQPGAAAPARVETLEYERHLSANRLRLAQIESATAHVTTDDEVFNLIIERAVRDLCLMISTTRDGLVAYAGVPWYTALFGRDAIITALEMLPWMPDLARGTLRHLARWQGAVMDDFTDQEPGKILHEYRKGEMAATREIPFIPYYGSVDATPLFLILLHEYYRCTGDAGLLEELWPVATRALEWMRHTADARGYLRYHTRSPRGLRNQGWKDSFDAVHHENGELAEPPIALAEVQSYAFRAYSGCVQMATARGDAKLAEDCKRRARHLYGAFNADFWLADAGYVALALDAASRPCRVLSSNAAQCLWGGILSARHARKLAPHLVSERLFSGFGIRTLGQGEARYNPISYHNGTVWPHDNALIAVGLGRYGLRRPLLQLFDALIDGLRSQPDYRVPELFCGFARTPGVGPVPYPVACAPQAWASAGVFALLASVMNIRLDGLRRTVRFLNPALPEWLTRIEVKGLPLAHGELAFNLTNTRGFVAIEVVAKPEGYRVVAETT